MDSVTSPTSTKTVVFNANALTLNSTSNGTTTTSSPSTLPLAGITPNSTLTPSGEGTPITQGFKQGTVTTGVNLSSPSSLGNEPEKRVSLEVSSAPTGNVALQGSVASFIGNPTITLPSATPQPTNPQTNGLTQALQNPTETILAFPATLNQNDSVSPTSSATVNATLLQLNGTNNANSSQQAFELNTLGASTLKTGLSQAYGSAQTTALQSGTSHFTELPKTLSLSSGGGTLSPTLTSSLLNASPAIGLLETGSDAPKVEEGTIERGNLGSTVYASADTPESQAQETSHMKGLFWAKLAATLPVTQEKARMAFMSGDTQTLKQASGKMQDHGISGSSLSMDLQLDQWVEGAVSSFASQTSHKDTTGEKANEQARDYTQQHGQGHGGQQKQQQDPQEQSKKGQSILGQALQDPEESFVNWQFLDKLLAS
ncbi:MAG: hypothetical protein ACKO37_07820 [Vampirovibrionales bacterium]